MPQNPDVSFNGTRAPLADELGLSARHGDETLDRLTALLARLCAAPMAGIWVVDEGLQFLASAAGTWSRELPPGSRLAEQVLHHDGALIVTDLRKDARFAQDPLVTGTPRARFFAGVGLYGREHQPIGALCVLDSQVRTLDPLARSALVDLGALLEDRLRLRADALSDPRSGACARAPFEDLAAREWRRARRDLAPISVIVASLDHHDELAVHGSALDHGMRAAALAMQYSLNRPGDCVCRYDDSRFVLLLPGTDGAGASHAAERVRLAIEALVIPLGADRALWLSLSQGIQTVPSEALTRHGLEDVVEAASAAMREAQGAGGNRWALTPATRRLTRHTIS